MSIIWFFLSLIFAFVAFNFLYWRNLKEDYISSKILTSGLIIMLLTLGLAVAPMLVTQYISDSSIFIKAGLWFWGGVIGFLLGVFISKWRFGFRLNESFDAAINGLWAFLAILCIPFYPVGLVICLILLGVYYLVKLNYKKFTVYRSGKIGIAGLITVGIFFIIRAVVAIFLDSHMLSLIGKIDGIMSATAVFITFLALYYLAYEQKK
jgi:hypothetical protein